MRTIDDQHLDVLIVGAGLSGIGAACHLERKSPQRTYAVLEARNRIGGTWDLFRYPGIRSDSDMHTLGYSFAPWKDGQAIADGPAILRYIRETADQFGVMDRVRTGHHVVRADFDSDTARWTVTARVDDEERTLSCAFLVMCTGYYDYAGGYTPQLPGLDRFAGTVIHPQLWPEDLDYTDKRVVVIGSGATAVTLVPAMSRTAAHVTMLQRSPSYVITVPAHDAMAVRLRRALPEKAAYGIVRWRNVALMTLSYQISRRWPRLMKSLIRRGAIRQLPVGYEVDTHFNPTYDPWDQRLCMVPDGDLFRALGSGRATIVTDRIETFTEHGIQTVAGRELPADIVVTATGLSLLALGGVTLAVDGAQVDVPETLAYKGMMLSGVPNFAFTIGYTNASWTLKADLTAQYVCRLLDHMSNNAHTTVVPVLGESETPREPLIGLNSGYVLRSLKDFPSQGPERPWRVHQNYALDLIDFRVGGVQDGVLHFSQAGQPVTAAPVAA